MKPQLIGKDTETIEQKRREIEKQLPYYTKVLQEFNKLDIGELEMRDFPDMKFGDEFLKAKIAQGVDQPEMGGVKLSKKKFMEMVDLPSNTKAFWDAVKELYGKFGKPGGSNSIFPNELPRVGNDTPYGLRQEEYLERISKRAKAETNKTVELNEYDFKRIVGDEVVLDEEAFNRFIEQNSYYVTTKEEKKVYEAYKKLTSTLNEVAPVLKKYEPNFAANGARISSTPNKRFPFLDWLDEIEPANDQFKFVIKPGIVRKVRSEENRNGAVV